VVYSWHQYCDSDMYTPRGVGRRGVIVVLPRNENVEGMEGETFEVIINLAEEDMRGLEEELRGGGWLVEKKL
jgi:hypothetical protein